MSIDPQPDTEQGSADNTVTLDSQQLKALIERIEQAIEHDLALCSEDYQLLLDALLTLANVQERLSHNQLTIHKLKKLFGILNSTERTSKLFPKKPEDTSGGADDQNGDNQDGKDQEVPPEGSDNKRKRKKRNRKSRNRRNTTPPQVIHHKLDGFEKGQLCPCCAHGRLYKYEPSQFVRIVGQAPLQAQRHVSEQMRCNGCGEIISADLPAEVQADGRPGQRFGYSARAVMAVYKYFAGMPLFRQQTLQDLFGTPISASSLYEQCAQVADSLDALWTQMKRLAADATLFHIDDTTHRILQARPIQKKRNGATRWRSGIYTSSLLAVVAHPDEPEQPDRSLRLVLFETGIGNAGEWLESVLGARTAHLPAPCVMSDALSSNTIHGTEHDRALCNAHARRQFADLAESDPLPSHKMLSWYQSIWINDDHCTEKHFDAEQRQRYHKAHSLPIMQTMKDYCEQNLAEHEGESAVEPNSNLGKAMQYYLNHHEDLTRFCQVPGAPIDNNEIERLIKIIVRGRKNFGFYRNEIGARVSDISTSTVVTCYENGVDPLDYLQVIQRYQPRVKASPQAWMPWNYQDELARLATGINARQAEVT